jgi:LysR family transcriptional activator of nhaA
MPQPACLVCQEGSHVDLLAKLATYELDLVLTDAPIGPNVRVRAFNHLLGECGVSVFAARKMATHYKRRFPDSLHEAPFLLPGTNTSLRHSMDGWFEERGFQPKIMGEIEDCALLKVFGQKGLGLFVMPTVEEEEVQRQYEVRLVGRLGEVRERFYAISTERRVVNPAVLAITEAAHKEIFD